MAYIDQIQISGITSGVVNIARRSFAVELWKWYEEHRNDKITAIKVWFINVKIHVRDVRPLFVILFGEPSKS